MTEFSVPPKEVLEQRLRYEPESGKLFWLPWTGAPKGWRGRWEGKEAFTALKPNGYAFGHMTLGEGERKKHYRMYAHRAVWKMVHDEDPEFVDHINGNRLDNRIANLRAVSRQENAINKRLRSDNGSGHHGVWETKHGTWRAYIGLGNRSTLIGTYPTKEYAIVARQAAEKVLGFHENHGK